MLSAASRWAMEERYKALDNMDLMSAPLLDTGLCLNSPDSVCPDTNSADLVADEPLKLDQTMLQFDPNMFANENFVLSLDARSLSVPRSSFTEDDATSQGSSFASPASSVAGGKIVEEEEEAETGAKRSGRKRMRRIASFNSGGAESDGYDEKGGVPSGKKSKSSSSASNRAPRSRMPTSAYRGVSRCTKDGRWQARIRIEKEVVYLGRYPTEEQAARRYDEAARIHHGAAAMLNFITPEDVLVGRKSVFASAEAPAAQQ